MIEWLYLKLFPSKDAIESPDQSKISFKLTPLDPFSVNFINIDDLNIDISSLQAVIPAIKSELKHIQSKLESFNKNQLKYLKSPLSDLLSKKAKDHSKLLITEETRTLSIIIHLYNKNLDKIKKHQIKYFDESINLCNQMIEFTQNVIEQKYPIKIDYNGFIQKIKDYISPNKNPDLIKLNNLSKSLYKMSNSSISELTIFKKNDSVSNTNCTPTAKQVHQSLKSNLVHFDQRCKFMKESPFDYVFESYIIADPIIMTKYDEILDEMSLFEYTKALSDLFEMTKMISSTFGLSYVDFADSSKATANDISEFYVIFYASTRFFFNQVTVNLPYLLTNDLSSKDFIKNCVAIQSMTPRELNAVKNVFLPCQLDKPVKEVFTENKRLRKSLDYFQLITFYNSPLDIAYLSNKAINIFNKEIYINMYLNKKCKGDPNGKVPGVKLDDDSIEDNTVTSADVNFDIAIAFDDLFTMFYMAMAMQPPPNAPALKVFLNAFSGVQMSQDIDYASTTLQASIDFISSLAQ